MRSLILALMLLAGAVSADAQERKFPYQALVEVDGEFVRSGPGPSFYPTDKLKKGDKVTVHRHDPGGWCMITPPPGSFSWIKSEHVQKSGEGTGVLRANKVVVHVGSSLNPEEFTTIQGNLSMGEAVQILGERTFPFEDGPKLMYKITPVRREWRWIPRKALIPADAIQSFPEGAPRKNDGGPVADQMDLDPDAFARPISTGDTVTGSEAAGGTSRPRVVLGNPEEVVPGFAEQLEEIDNSFRTMVKGEPAAWNLAEIKRKYTELDNEATQPSQSRLIAVRLDAVDRYQKTHSDYLNFLKISEAARQRDAQLAQQQLEAERLAVGAAPTPGPLSPQPQGPQPFVPQPGQTQPGLPPQNGPTPIVPGPGTPGTAPGTAPENGQPRFAGAGMVVSLSQSIPGGPQYALVVPGGKLLAYLVPAQGVDLRRSVNQTMGIHGERSFRQEWGADVIVVRSLQPVQLRSQR